MRSAVEAALARAVGFLETVQLPTGELPVLTTTDPAMRCNAVVDPSVFPSALAAHCLSAWPAAHRIRDRICDFLTAEALAPGLWRHWPRSHPHAGSLPPDLDDTACASLALRLAGRPHPDNRALLLANRDNQGRFFTWLSPRPRWAGWAHFKVAVRQLAHLPTLVMFFRATSAKPLDVDAVVNANTLLYLGAFEGDQAVIAWLAEVLRRGGEHECDKWYDSPVVVRYFLTRALQDFLSKGEMNVAPRCDVEPANAMEAAMALTTALNLGRRPDDTAVAALLAKQQADGAWARAPLYHGGRARRRKGGFDPPHRDTPRWGSEAISTALAIEALARCLDAEP